MRSNFGPDSRRVKRYMLDKELRRNNFSPIKQVGTQIWTATSTVLQRHICINKHTSPGTGYGSWVLFHINILFRLSVYSSRLKCQSLHSSLKKP